MRFIEPHAHPVSRTTDDYEKMALAGCRAVSEPAFWAGFDRSSAGSFRDYFRHLTEFEPRRAAKYGLAHFCWLCINPKESEDLRLAEEVLALIPEFLDRPTVLGLGEVGLNKNSVNEVAILERHLDLAARRNLLVLIHTPHLEDKLKGTRLTLDCLRHFPALPPERVIIDHLEEHTIPLVRDRGYWAGLTLYPVTKCSIPRAADLIERYGSERIWMNGACDWGVSDPLAVPRAALELQARGFTDDQVDRIIYRNPRQFLAQHPGFADAVPA